MSKKKRNTKPKVMITGDYFHGHLKHLAGPDQVRVYLDGIRVPVSKNVTTACELTGQIICGVDNDFEHDFEEQLLQGEVRICGLPNRDRRRLSRHTHLK